MRFPRKMTPQSPFANPWQNPALFANPWQIPKSTPPPPRHGGFTLIELLLALAIFALVMTMAGGAFWSIMHAWQRGSAMLDQLHYGEYVMEQLVSAIRSAAWFPSKPTAYGFLLDDAGGTSHDAANKIEFTTSGTAFLSPHSPYRNGLHRLAITVNGSGNERGLAIQAWPHMTASEDLSRNAVESLTISTEICGFSCEWYDFEAENWSQKWEKTNSLPKLVRATLTMKPRGKRHESIQLQRIISIPVAPDLPGHEKQTPAPTRPDSSPSARPTTPPPHSDNKKTTPPAAPPPRAHPSPAPSSPPPRTTRPTLKTTGRTISFSP